MDGKQSIDNPYRLNQKPIREWLCFAQPFSYWFLGANAFGDRIKKE